MKLFAIEGNLQHLDGGAMFGNAPKAMWEKWIKPDDNNRIPLACRALLVQTDKGKNVLFETGIGAFFEPKLKERYGVVPQEHVLLKNLEAVGVNENDMDAVVLSHLHFDHAGGLLSAYGDGPMRLHFPNARYYVGKIHWEYSQKPHPRERASFIPELINLLKNSGRLCLVDENSHPDLDASFTFHFSDGHTKGLMVSEIELFDGSLIFATDLIPGNPWVHLPIVMGYDRFPELKVDEKERVFKSIIGRKGRLFYTHDPKIICARLQQDESGKFFGEPCSF